MTDYLFLMESRLSIEQAKAMQRVQSAAESLSVTLYLIGGAIRDLICGFAIDDLDFVVEGKALQLVRALGRDVKVLWQDDALQTAEMEFASGVAASISMARSETFSESGARSIAAAPILLDLRRRDFSINALGVSLNAQSRGLLLDPTNGAGDIASREIRALHKRSFIEDPVRMLRAVRFRTRLGFALEQKTAALYEAAKEMRLQEKISGESLTHELRRIARERNPAEILKALDKENLLPAIHPHLHGDRLNLKSIDHAAKTSQALAPLGVRPPSFELILHLLLAKLPAGSQSQLLKRLGLNKSELGALRDLESSAKRLGKELMGKAGSSPTSLFKLLSAAPSDLILLLQMEYPQAKLQSRIKSYLQKYLPLRMQLPSQELASLGVAAGTPQHEKILEAYFYAVLEGKLHGKTDHTRFLRRMAEPYAPKPVEREHKPAPPREAAETARKATQTTRGKAPTPGATPAATSAIASAVVSGIRPGIAPGRASGMAAKISRAPQGAAGKATPARAGIKVQPEKTAPRKAPAPKPAREEHRAASQRRTAPATPRKPSPTSRKSLAGKGSKRDAKRSASAKRRP